MEGCKLPRVASRSEFGSQRYAWPIPTLTFTDSHHLSIANNQYRSTVFTPRTHGETGRKALYLGGTADKVWIVGMPLDESNDIVQKLWKHVTSTDRVFAQDWEVGDIVMWDNRCTMHRRDRDAVSVHVKPENVIILHE